MNKVLFDHKHDTTFIVTLDVGLLVHPVQQVSLSACPQVYGRATLHFSSLQLQLCKDR